MISFQCLHFLIQMNKSFETVHVHCTYKIEIVLEIGVAGVYLHVSTVKPVLSGHSKIDKTKVLKTNGSLMKVESIAAFCNTFYLH